MSVNLMIVFSGEAELDSRGCFTEVDYQDELCDQIERLGGNVPSSWRSGNAKRILAQLASVSQSSMAPVPEKLYRCVKRSQFRETSAMDSALSGILNVGDEISALESCLLDTGVTRVRCEKGWASLSTSYGTVILEDITCRDEQAAGETSTPAATSTEHVSHGPADSPSSAPLSSKPWVSRIVEWSVADVEYWVRIYLQLPQYAPQFRHRNVSGALLMLMSEETLRTRFAVEDDTARARIMAAVQELREAAYRAAQIMPRAGQIEHASSCVRALAAVMQSS